MYRENIVKQAQNWIGKKESDGSFKEIINTYNNHTPRARGYSVKYTDEWCATFVSAVAIKCGATSIIPTECSCQKMIELFKGLGEWQENENYTPKAGDVIFYDWQDNGNGDCTGWSDHVGIVESVNGSTITVIEGNYNSAVRRRNLKVNGKYIRGFGLPKYTEKVETVITNNTVSSTLPNLSGYTGKSIVDGLKSVGVDSSFNNRANLWKLCGYQTTYEGSASQNETLLNRLKGVQTNTVSLPSLKGYKGFSIVDGLKSFGYESTFSYRKKLWSAIGKTDTYKGTATQNNTLLNYLKSV